MFFKLLCLFVVFLLALGIVIHVRRNARNSDLSIPLDPAQTSLRQRLSQHVNFLAATVGERHLGKPEKLAAAAEYIRSQLAATGLPVHRESYTVMGQSVANYWVQWEGNESSGKTLVVGAHYDTVPGTPGANDNGSGIAALLEISRAFQTLAPAIDLRLVAFVNEEPPYFQTESMGSLHHARWTSQQGDEIIGMVTLETIGYYSITRGSQDYPVPGMRLYYPSAGNFVAFVGNFNSFSLLRSGLSAFRKSSHFPAEGLVAPETLPGIGWSDHWSFWQQGYPAIMITDTALYRYPHYHLAGDRPEQLDMDSYTKVVDGVIGMLETLTAVTSQE